MNNNAHLDKIVLTIHPSADLFLHEMAAIFIKLEAANIYQICEIT